MAIPWVLYGSAAQLTGKTLGRYVFRLVHTTAHAVQYQVAKCHRALSRSGACFAMGGEEHDQLLSKPNERPISVLHCQ